MSVQFGAIGFTESGMPAILRRRVTNLSVTAGVFNQYDRPQ